MSLANTCGPTQRNVVANDGVQLELMGHVGSPRGVDFLAFELVPDQTFENCITIIRHNICFLHRITPGAVMSVERRSHQPVGPLNFFAPGVSMEPARVPISGVLCFFDEQFLTKLVEIEPDLNINKIDFLTSIDSRRLAYIGQEMLREALSPGFGGALLAEAMAMNAALEISRYDGARRCDEALLGGGLAPWQIRRLEDYVSAHLADDLTLTGLADLLDISVRHLSRVVQTGQGSKRASLGRCSAHGGGATAPVGEQSSAA